ncbi:MAG: Uma2 family endonuclease [Chloroflexota bacterium]
MRTQPMIKPRPVEPMPTTPPLLNGFLDTDFLDTDFLDTDLLDTDLLNTDQTRLEPDEQSEDGKFVSEKVYWENYYETELNYEWNNGILEQVPMASFSQSRMYYWFIKLLGHYLEQYQIADTVMLEIGFRLALPHKTAVRKPDLGVIRRDNPMPIQPDDRSYHGTFDLCIESLSDSNRREVRRDTVDKLDEYRSVGVREYYILDDRQNRHMAFYRLNAAGVYVPIRPTADGIIRSDVLPRFQFREQDLYNQPSTIQLANDSVYQGFVMTEYQRERLRANQEAQRASQEAQRAAQVLERSVRYAEKLRELGIDPDTL